jgi:hypothetical protein
MYVVGRGVKEDVVQAHKWLNLAASRASGKEADDAVHARDKLAGYMTTAQVAEAQRLASAWKPSTQPSGSNLHPAGGGR